MCEIVVALKIAPITFALQLGMQFSQQLCSQVILHYLYHAVNNTTLKKTIQAHISCGVSRSLLGNGSYQYTSTAVRSMDKGHKIGLMVFVSPKHWQHDDSTIYIMTT